MNYDLPTSVYIDEKEYKIRSDYRAILDICSALTDPELTNEDKVIVCLNIFYEDFENLAYNDWNEALNECFRFIRMGREDEGHRQKKLMDWEQDFQLIVAPVNRVLGTEIRALPYLHWWTFISAYYEIGDCTFAQVIRIRDQLSKGKQLDKTDREWYRDHADIVNLKSTYTEAEKKLLEEWGIK